MALRPRRGLPGARFRDPRLDLAQRLLAQGTRTTPILSDTQGFARLGQTLAGTLMQQDFLRREREREEAERQRQQQAIANQQAASQAAVRGASALPFRNPDTGVVDPNQAPAGGTAGALAALQGLNTPEASNLALQLQLSDIQNQQAIARQRPPQDTSQVRNFQFAQSQGFQGTFPEFLAQTRRSTEVRIPQGFQPDPSVPGGLQPIPGGPQDPQTRAEQETAERTAQADVERRQNFPRAQQALAGLERRTETMLNAIDQALGVPAQGDQPAREGQIGPFTTGFPGGLLMETGGTPQFDLSQTLDTIRANIGFDELQAMREASPTGGALGAVSERENALLQALRGSLSQQQSEDQLRANLQAIRDNLVAVQQERRAAFQQDFGDMLEGERIGNQTPQSQEEITEEDIQETMRANNMTREQVLDELRRRAGQ